MHQNYGQAGDKKSLHEGVKKRITQRVGYLGVDKAGVVDENQSTGGLVVAVQRQGIDLDGGVVGPRKLAVTGVVFRSLDGGRRTGWKKGGQALRAGDHRPASVVDDDAL